MLSLLSHSIYTYVVKRILTAVQNIKCFHFTNRYFSLIAMLITSIPGSILDIVFKPATGGIVGDTVGDGRGLTDGVVDGMGTVADEAMVDCVVTVCGGSTVGGRGTVAAAEAMVDCVDTVRMVDGAVTIGRRATVDTVGMSDGMDTVDGASTVVLEAEE